MIVSYFSFANILRAISLGKLGKRKIAQSEQNWAIADKIREMDFEATVGSRLEKTL